MFIGHYGPAFGAKAAVKTIPLWVLFIAVQWMDVWWSIFVLTGVEKLRIVPGYTQGSPLDLYYMPYTHGLLGALVLSAILGAIVAIFMRGQRALVFLVVAAAVFSHWICDLIVHVPDLPLYDNTLKVGFGLWRHMWLSLPLELIFLFVGAWFYVRYVPAKPRGNLWLWLFVGAMAAVEIYNAFAPPAADNRSFAIMALAAYGGFAVLAFFVDRTRVRN